MLLDFMVVYLLASVCFFCLSFPFIDTHFDGETRKKFALWGAIFFWPVTLPFFALFCAAAGVLVICEWVIDQIMPT